MLIVPLSIASSSSESLARARVRRCLTAACSIPSTSAISSCARPSTATSRSTSRCAGLRRATATSRCRSASLSPSSSAIYDVSEARNTTGIPLGVFMGYAIAGSSGPGLDVAPYFNFPYFVMPGRTPVMHTGQYVVGLNLSGHLYL